MKIPAVIVRHRDPCLDNAASRKAGDEPVLGFFISVTVNGEMRGADRFGMSPLIRLNAHVIAGLLHEGGDVIYRSAIPLCPGITIAVPVCARVLVGNFLEVLQMVPKRG